MGRRLRDGGRAPGREDARAAGHLRVSAPRSSEKRRIIHRPPGFVGSCRGKRPTRGRPYGRSTHASRRPNLAPSNKGTGHRRRPSALLFGKHLHPSTVAGVLASVFLGATPAAAAVVWGGDLGMAGFFGYGLGVEARYRQLLAIRRAEPRTAKDASGLLDGRAGQGGRLLSSHRRRRQSLPRLRCATAVEAAEVHLLKLRNA
ncbi:uncharacterized protein LOC120680989 [Panicum virgatum]|uniref:uncharacterized protein LOC120680989 n=1 Tax=Panicum virgatum TaxID=38727 RepID=UPI0019D5929F|nr:uncharacterized protein LOC120680989 [Panicum virgatum]